MPDFKLITCFADSSLISLVRHYEAAGGCREPIYHRILKYYTYREGIYSIFLQPNDDTSISMQV